MGLKPLHLIDNIVSKFLIGALLVISLSTDADAALNWRKYVYSSNQGGLNDQQSTTEIADNEATDIQNIVFDNGGALKKRFGYLSVPSPIKIATGTSVYVTGLAYFKLDNGNKFLVGVCNTDSSASVVQLTYAASGAFTGFWDLINGAVSQTTYSNNNLCDFAISQDRLVFTIGTQNKPFAWTGTGDATVLTNDTDIPNSTIVEYHRNHLFLAGNTTNPSRIYFSNIDDITAWTSTDFFDIETSDGSQVRALLSTYNGLYIFKDYNIWRLSGSDRDSFRLEKMVQGVGCMSNLSPVATNSGIYFTTSYGNTVLYDGAYTAQNISRKTANTISNFNKARTQYYLGLAFSTYRFQDFDYYIAVPTGAKTSNDQVLLFDTQYGAWTKFAGMSPTAWCIGDDSSTKKVMYFGDSSGYVYSYPSTGYHDGGVATSAIATVYQTKWFTYPETALGDKYWRLMKVYALSQDGVTLHAECRSDYESSGKVVDISLEGSQANWDVDLWDVALWGGDTIIVGRSEIEKGKEMFQIRFYNDDVDDGFTIIKFENFIEGEERV